MFEQILPTTIFIITTLILLQSALFLYALIFAWVHPQRVSANRSPKKFAKPKFSFTALLPARHEEKVIADTIRKVASIDYPDELKQILVICRTDDEGTIKQAQKAIDSLGKDFIQLITFSDYPINKPHGLNVALPYAVKDVLVIFDAEDEPSSDIFNIVNTVMQRDKADVVQAGVQLMNFRSNWFSTLNVLEYFFWFKSALHFFNLMGVTPLGGNTIFFKRILVERLGGWDEKALTEDAAIGMNLSRAGAKIRIVYDEKHATQEETPPTVASFIKQRTRWDQGFMQVLLKGEWLKMKTLNQKILAGYLMAWPEVQMLYFLYLPVSLLSVFLIKLPVWLAIYSIFPMYMFFLMFVALNVGLWEFAKEYGKKYPIYMPLKMLFTFWPYQVLLGIAALRATFRLAQGNLKWEKTAHIGAHRVPAVDIGRDLAIED